MDFELFKNLANSHFVRTKMQQIAKSFPPHTSLHPLVEIAHTGWFILPKSSGMARNLVNLSVLRNGASYSSSTNKVINDVLATAITLHKYQYPEQHRVINDLIEDYLKFQYMYLTGPEYFKDELKAYHKRGLYLSVEVDGILGFGIDRIIKLKSKGVRTSYLAGDYQICEYVPWFTLYLSKGSGILRFSRTDIEYAMQLAKEEEKEIMSINF